MDHVLASQRLRGPSPVNSVAHVPVILEELSKFFGREIRPRKLQLEPRSFPVATFIHLALSNFPLTFLILGLLVAFFSIVLSKQPKTSERVREKIFANFLLFALGISFFYNFVMHVFFGTMAAQFIGWQNSPFQAEVGFASLGFAVVALLAVRGCHGLRVGAVVGPACFLLGAAAGHIREIVLSHNFAAGNAGIMLYMDVLIPVIALALLWMERRSLPPCLRQAAQ
jgi:hypothetical protein